MVERMSNKAKAEALERVAKLIEDNLGYNVARKVRHGLTDAGILSSLAIVGDQPDKTGLIDAYIEMEDEKAGGYSYRTSYTGKIRVIITDTRYGRGGFRKWSLLHNLNFEKGMADKKTATFLGKVKELVERRIDQEQHKARMTTKRLNDTKWLTDWADTKIPKGYKLVDRFGKWVLVMDGENEYSSDFQVGIGIVSPYMSENLGDQDPIYITIFNKTVYGDRVYGALQMFRELYDFIKNNK